ncbi:hypothetical protein C0Q70_08723 [Pomacea canaliculata]|uniref:Uncharacterized protein n=1 Tax=Pomacea canaliculata TaxID=400727 RepID=A0A2T7P7S2_POMCA|nr:hypothetical protein C0Q70_08723 [Pomacea canaliculata]
MAGHRDGEHQDRLRDSQTCDETSTRLSAHTEDCCAGWSIVCTLTQRQWHQLVAPQSYRSGCLQMAEQGELSRGLTNGRKGRQQDR